jgi:hypothetical protein
MKPLLARITDVAESTDRRRAGRRTVRLDVSAQSATAESTIMIRNISRTGLLVETKAALSVGETFMLVLPEVGPAPARVKWQKGRRFGCEFLSPVTAAAISAALLKTPFGAEDSAVAEPVAQAEYSEYIAPDRAPNTLLTYAMTALFTGAILLFLFALVALNFSG